jgi:hydrogenase maturation factor
MTLPKGKLHFPDLERLVFPHIPRVEDPRKVTLDYATTTVQGNLVVASDPVIGIPLQFYGFFAVHYSATDVAMSGGTPQFLNLGIYYPPETEESWLTNTLQQLGKEANELNLKVVSGHTGGYDGLHVPLINTTCFGILTGDPFQPSQVKPDDVIIAVGPVTRETLWFLANVEPTHVDAILSRSQREALAVDLSPFSIVPVVKSLPREGVLLLHDLAEGGLATGLKELQTATSCGITIRYQDVPWDEVGIQLFEYLKWNPLHCSSFGSFLIVSTNESADAIIQAVKTCNREAAVIGQFTKKKRILIEYPDKSKPLEPGEDPYQRFTSNII